MVRFTDKVLPIKQTLSNCLNHHFFRFGLPFLLLVVGLSFATVPFHEVRIERRKSNINQELLTKAGLKNVNYIEEFEKIKTADTSNYKNIRGPRPWEDNTEWLESREKQKQLEQITK